MNTGNSKTSEPRESNKHVAFLNLSIYYTWNNIRKQYKNNKPEIITPTWNDKSEFPDGFYSLSDIQDYIEYIIKKHEKLKIVPSIHVYIIELIKD